MRIIPRSEWGARPATNRADFTARDRIVAHWWASPNWRWVTDHGGPAAAMRHVQRLHQRRGGWDIYYNFCIAQDGGIYEGRGFGNRGGAQGVPSSDRKDLSVAFMVGPVGAWPGPTEAPSDEAVAAFAWLIHEARRHGFGGKIIGHNDTKPKACPGPELEALVDAWVDGPPDEPEDDMRDLWLAKLKAMTLEDWQGIDAVRDIGTARYWWFADPDRPGAPPSDAEYLGDALPAVLEALLRTPSQLGGGPHDHDGRYARLDHDHDFAAWPHSHTVTGRAD